VSSPPWRATKAWRTARIATLVRDGYRCQINGPGCTHVATEADHIVETSIGGAVYDLGNLRAACKPCNSSRGASHGNRIREPRTEAWW